MPIKLNSNAFASLQEQVDVNTKNIDQMYEDPPTFNPRGEYSSANTYLFPDMVSYQGSSYVCTSRSIIQNIPPTNTTYWQIMALRGMTGNVGAQGPKGDTGDQGPKGDTGATGAQGPKGDTGATGAQGPAGASVQTVSVTKPSATTARIDTILTDGSSVQSNAFTLPQGPKGDPGGALTLKTGVSSLDADGATVKFNIDLTANLWFITINASLASGGGQVFVSAPFLGVEFDAAVIVGPSNSLGFARFETSGSQVRVSFYSVSDPTTKLQLDANYITAAIKYYGT